MMNTPPLLRSLRPFLQGRLSIAAARPSPRHVFQPTLQLRANGSIAKEPAIVKVGLQQPSSSSSSKPDEVVTSPEEPTANTASSAAPAPVDSLATDEAKSAAPPSVAEAATGLTADQPKKAEVEKAESEQIKTESVEAEKVDAPPSMVAQMEAMATFATETQQQKVPLKVAAQDEKPKPAPSVTAAIQSMADEAKRNEAADRAMAAEKGVGVSRMPRSLEALYLRPLKRVPEYGLPVCNLHLRSYSITPLEFFCDFALRAAYYLGLPASGPVPLPRKTERWTVPRSHFIFKKSQENFSRTTLRRLIQIKDGHPETVQIWLAFLQKHAYYGIGMKANVWEFSKADVSKNMDANVAEVEKALEDKWPLMGVKGMSNPKELEAFIAKERLDASGGR